MIFFRVCLNFAVCAVFGLLGCAHPISDNLRHAVNPSLSFTQVFVSPESHVGKTAMFGGMIVSTRVLPDSSEIEVIEKELNSVGSPERGDTSGGRFIFVKKGFLEPEIYARGRYVTGAGKIKGGKAGRVDGQEYRFPLIEVEELHLWERNERPYYDDRFYDPFRHPFYSPFYRYPYW